MKQNTMTAAELEKQFMNEFQRDVKRLRPYHQKSTLRAFLLSFGWPHAIWSWWHAGDWLRSLKADGRILSYKIPRLTLSRNLRLDYKIPAAVLDGLKYIYIYYVGTISR